MRWRKKLTPGPYRITGHTSSRTCSFDRNISPDGVIEGLTPIQVRERLHLEQEQARSSTSSPLSRHVLSEHGYTAEEFSRSRGPSHRLARSHSSQVSKPKLDLQAWIGPPVLASRIFTDDGPVVASSSSTRGLLMTVKAGNYGQYDRRNGSVPSSTLEEVGYVGTKEQSTKVKLIENWRTDIRNSNVQSVVFDTNEMVSRRVFSCNSPEGLKNQNNSYPSIFINLAPRAENTRKKEVKEEEQEEKDYSEEEFGDEMIDDDDRNVEQEQEDGEEEEGENEEVDDEGEAGEVRVDGEIIDFRAGGRERRMTRIVKEEEPEEEFEEAEEEENEEVENEEEFVSSTYDDRVAKIKGDRVLDELEEEELSEITQNICDNEELYNKKEEENGEDLGLSGYIDSEESKEEFSCGMEDEGDQPRSLTLKMKEKSREIDGSASCYSESADVNTEQVSNDDFDSDLILEEEILSEISWQSSEEEGILRGKYYAKHAFKEIGVKEAFDDRRISPKNYREKEKDNDDINSKLIEENHKPKNHTFINDKCLEWSTTSVNSSTYGSHRSPQHRKYPIRHQKCSDGQRTEIPESMWSQLTNVQEAISGVEYIAQHYKNADYTDGVS
ncbi:unnamed protein product [Protopolystoma xenopodis]|uniref:Uncharacterized protein n=1 Tax=Protopolystoma xenopodis TaxID=117903 RepID=A0A3S5BQG9_9PLAT|nr:unnamed protein product [Protopolystoma xenopodis]